MNCEDCDDCEDLFYDYRIKTKKIKNLKYNLDSKPSHHSSHLTQPTHFLRGFKHLKI